MVSKLLDNSILPQSKNKKKVNPTKKILKYNLDISKNLAFVQGDREKRNTLNGMDDNIIYVLRKKPCLFLKLLIVIYKFIP